MSERDEFSRDPALSGVYRQGTTLEPPAALDAAILAAARQAVQPVTVRPQTWWKRLRTPMALTATVLLAVMLTFTVERQPAELPPPVLDEQAPAPVERLEPMPPHAVPAAKADAPLAKAKKAVPAAPAKAEQMAAPAAAPVPGSALPQPAAPPAPVMRDALREERSNAVASGAAAPPAREAAEEARKEVSRAAPAASLRAAKPAMRPVEDWVEEIRQLRRQGKLEEAERRLVELRQAHPEYVLPEDLRR